MNTAGLWNAIRGLQSFAATAANLDLSRLAESNAKLVRRLHGFSFNAIANAAGGLLTSPENQPATFRLEALVALAATFARGDKIPTATHLREWLNTSLLGDPIGQLEDPVEDVFVSNVSSHTGNARLFDGLWSDNDAGVEAVLQALKKLTGQAWAAAALDHCMALLTLSEKVAERSAVERYTMSTGGPKRPIRILATELDALSSRVRFTTDDLRDLDIRARRLKPFVLMDHDRAAVQRETIGHSSVERKPLVWDGANIVVALPTAIGAAIRRHVVEEARAAGALAEVEDAIRLAQFSEIHEFGMIGLRARRIRAAEELGREGYDLVARFDEGAYLHLLFVADDLGEALEQGPRSLHTVSAAIVSRANLVASEISGQADYRRGLTLVVHGGVGRGFAIPFDQAPPPSWHRIPIDYPDLARLAWEQGFDALRMWKFVDQEQRLQERGYRLQNVNGFTNLYGFMRSHGMAMVPDAASPGAISLASDHVASLRNFLRSVLDNHVVVGPEGTHWVQVRRTATEVFFAEVEGLPLYASPRDLAAGRRSACIETSSRPWWVTIHTQAQTPTGRTIEYKVWEMARDWMVRAAARLDARLPGRPTGPVTVRLEVPGADNFGADEAFASDEFGKPTVRLDGGVIVVTCDAAQLASFARASNVGERQVVAAFAEGAAMLAGSTITQDQLERISGDVTGPGNARFFHVIPPRSPSTLVYSASGDRLGRPRLVQDEDIGWSRLGLAGTANWTGGVGPVAEADAPALLNDAVEGIWERMRPVLEGLDRDGLVTKALMNHDAIAWDRTTWRQTASALLDLYSDTQDVVAAANKLEAQRGAAGLCSRILVEMGVCTCPETGGSPVTQADFDALLADLAILIECANQADAIHWKLTATMPVVNPNGSLSFDSSFLEAQQRPYVEAHGELAFRDAAAGYESLFAKPGAPGELKVDPAFLAAIEAEYGISLHALARFTAELSNEAAADANNILRLSRAEVIKRLAGRPDDYPASDPERAYETLTLQPRAQWDEKPPAGAKARDWYPWRYSRRLSLLQRPLVQVGTDDDPLVLVLPTLVDSFVQRLFMAGEGSLPMDLYTSKPMRSWIGTAVNREGHAFNELVSERLTDLGWKTRPDVNMTELGGKKAMGDVDVLAWDAASGTVVAIECKRLQVARSIGEIGERLAEYARVAEPGKPRTPIQKHLDRLDALRENPAMLSRVTGIAIDRVKLKAALVTDHLVPMQFSDRAGTLVDVMADYPSLERLLAVPLPSD